MSLSMNEFASRPVYAASAVRMSFILLGAVASFAVGKAALAQAPTAPALFERAPVRSEVVGVSASEKDVCRQVTVETDEGYGVRGHVTRWVCRKAY